MAINLAFKSAIRLICHRLLFCEWNFRNSIDQPPGLNFLKLPADPFTSYSAQQRLVSELEKFNWVVLILHEIDLSSVDCLLSWVYQHAAKNQG